MASMDVKAEVECSICLNFSTDPVTLKCGHNLCRDCIDRGLGTQEGSGGFSCLECRKKFPDRPALQGSITKRNIARPNQESRVFCTYCMDSPVPAVRSCLHCEVSLCDKHLKAHKKSPEHILCDPTLSMERRKCSIHKKILEYYCTEDETCICVSCCLIGGHTGHKMESLDEASEKKKETLWNVLQKLLTKTEEMEERVQSLQEHRRKVEEEAAGDTERVTVLFRDLRRRLEELEKRILRDISGQAEGVSTSTFNFIRDLEIKKEQLSRKIRHIEELCNMTDPLTVLQESDTGDLCDTEDGDNEDRERHEKLLHDGGGLDVAGVLHTGLSDIIKGVNVHFYIQGAADILLDGNTASNNIQMSDNRKTASRSDIDQNYPETPERFQDYPQVMSSQSSSSGSHYQDIDVGGSESWRVEMCYPADILLDVNAASNNLQISDGRKTTSRSDIDQNHPKTPERFQYCPQVISSQSSSSGQHYRHVDVGGPESWRVEMRHPADILLDVKTAHNKLHISDDGKTVFRSDRNQKRPQVPERFQYCPQVMSSQSFSSGRHYWEVDVGGSHEWIVGMCYPSIERRGRKSEIGKNNISWGLDRSDNRYFVIHGSKDIPLPTNLSSNRVRVYLDYEAGRISFYDLCDPIRHLHTFTTTFTEPLHAVFNVFEGYIKICGGGDGRILP